MPKERKDYTYVNDWKSLWEPDVEAIAYNGATCDPTRVDPKVLDWIRENCPDKPRFVKVINRNAAYGQPGLLGRSSPCIAVPAPFVQEHFRDLGRVVTLENGEGRKWKVAFVAAARHPLWIQGWKRFAKDHDLKPGDVVVFEFSGNSHFHFTIFDEDGNISTSPPRGAGVRGEATNSRAPRSQQLPSAPESDEIPTTNKLYLSADNDTEAELEAENEAGASSRDSHGHTQAPAIPSKRRRLRKMADIGKVQTVNADTLMEVEVKSFPDDLSAPNPQSDSGKGAKTPSSDPFNPFAVMVLSKRRTVTTVERQRARDLAEAYALTVTASPKFLVVMTQDHLHEVFRMILPDRFVADAGIPTSFARVSLVDCTGKEWEVPSRGEHEIPSPILPKAVGVVRSPAPPRGRRRLSVSAQLQESSHHSRSNLPSGPHSSGGQKLTS